MLGVCAHVPGCIWQVKQQTGNMQDNSSPIALQAGCTWCHRTKAMLQLLLAEVPHRLFSRHVVRPLLTATVLCLCVSFACSCPSCLRRAAMPSL